MNRDWEECSEKRDVLGPSEQQREAGARCYHNPTRHRTCCRMAPHVARSPQIGHTSHTRLEAEHVNKVDTPASVADNLGNLDGRLECLLCSPTLLCGQIASLVQGSNLRTALGACACRRCNRHRAKRWEELAGEEGCG